MLRQNQPRDLAQSTLGTVSRHGVPDFLRASEPNALALRFTLPTLPELQGKGGRGYPLGRCCAKEIRASGKYRQPV
jgi:hypothetical protein